MEKPKTQIEPDSGKEKFMKLIFRFMLCSFVMTALILPLSSSAEKKYDINTLAGKVASVNGTAGLQIRFSAFIQEEAQEIFAAPNSSSPITPPFVLSSPLDGTTIATPDVTVNQDTAAAPQNETSIAVDPNTPNWVVASANDYVTRTWSCTSRAHPAVPWEMATPAPTSPMMEARRGAVRAAIPATSEP